MLEIAFIHGGGQGGWVWDETIAALDMQCGGRVRALALDVPGCGAKRGAATDALTLDDVADDLIRDIVDAGLRRPLLVAHSQGGQAAALMAQRWPDLIRRVVHVACSIPLPGQNVAGMMGGGLHGSHPDEVGWPVEPARSTTADRFALMFCNDMTAAQRDRFLAGTGADHWPAATYRHTAWPSVAPGGVPATFVICLKDNSLPVAWQERFADRLGAERRVRLDAGHQAMTTRPASLAEIVRAEVDAD